MAAAIAFAMISGVSVITLTVLASLPEDAAAARSAAADVPPMAVPEPRSPEVPHRVRALVPIEILRVIDGDTIEVRARIWLDQFLVTRVRLRDIDAPEFTGRCPAEMVRAEAAKRHLSALAGSGPAYLADVGQDKYGGGGCWGGSLPPMAGISRAACWPTAMRGPMAGGAGTPVLSGAGWKAAARLSPMLALRGEEG